jgi:hypothetical protein
VLAAVAAVRQPVLTALLGGVLLGLPLAAPFALVEINARERRYGRRIYLDSRTRRLYLGAHARNAELIGPPALHAWCARYRNRQTADARKLRLTCERLLLPGDIPALNGTLLECRPRVG